MDGHIELDEGSSKDARDIKTVIKKATDAFYGLQPIFDKMNTMKDGDGSQSSHFAKVVTLYAVQGADQSAKLVNAKAMYDELNSTLGNSAALKQFLSKLG